MENLNPNFWAIVRKRLYEAQGNVCKLCKGNNNHLCIEHNHKDGKIRGVVCGSCNGIISLVESSLYETDRLGRKMISKPKIPIEIIIEYCKNTLSDEHKQILRNAFEELL
jgi:hypothetical protein